MPSGKIPQRLRDFGQEFQGMVGDGMGKPMYLGVQLGRDRTNAEPLKRMHESMGKAVQTVAMRHDTFTLDIVENSTYLFGRKFMVIEK